MNIILRVLENGLHDAASSSALRTMKNTSCIQYNVQCRFVHLPVPELCTYPSASVGARGGFGGVELRIPSMGPADMTDIFSPLLTLVLTSHRFGVNIPRSSPWGFSFCAFLHFCTQGANPHYCERHCPIPPSRGEAGEDARSW